MNDEPTFSGFAADRARPSVGATLRAAREGQGLTLADIANQTRVPLRHLEAIEADNHDALPALPYTIGFVKTLARAVGVDPNAAVAQYRAETSKVAHVPTIVHLEPVDESRVPPRWLVFAAIVLIAVILGVVWAYGEGMFSRSDLKPAETPVAEESAPATTPPPPVQEASPSTQVEGQYAASSSGAAPLAAGQSTDPNGVVAPEAAANEPAADATPPAPAAATPVAGGPIVITATDDAWFKVYDKGTRQSVKMGILKAGERYTVPADRDDLLLWTGKAGALRISVGGRTLPPLGGPETMIKDVPLTPAGLQARGAN